MGTSLTPNLGLIKPDGSESAGNWDNQWATNADTLDSEINTIKSGGAQVSRRMATNKTTSGSSSITTTETVTQTVVANLVAGKKYRVTHYGRYTTDVAATRFTARIREDNVSGTEVTGSTFEIPSTSGAATVERIEAEFDAVSTGPKTFVSTLIRGAGTGAGVMGSNSYLYVDYVRE